MNESLRSPEDTYTDHAAHAHEAIEHAAREELARRAMHFVTVPEFDTAPRLFRQWVAEQFGSQPGIVRPWRLARLWAANQCHVESALYLGQLNLSMVEILEA